MKILFSFPSGPSELAALVKENAKQGLQELLGPDDPANATENVPNSLRALYGKVCSEAVRHENHADLKPLSWQQKQLRDPDNYGISCMLWTWQQLSVRKNCGIVRRSRLSAYA